MPNTPSSTTSWSAGQAPRTLTPDQVAFQKEQARRAEEQNLAQVFAPKAFQAGAFQ